MQITLGKSTTMATTITTTSTTITASPSAPLKNKLDQLSLMAESNAEERRRTYPSR